MAFTVTFTSRASDENGDDDIYDFLDHGILKVTKATGQTAYYALDLWNSLTAEANHEPGGPKGGGVPPNSVH